MSSEDRAKRGWVRAVTNVNAKILFALLFVGWALVFGIGLQLVPHEGANSPYGGLALIAMFSGFFIMMGLLWAVIGDCLRSLATGPQGGSPAPQRAFRHSCPSGDARGDWPPTGTMNAMVPNRPQVWRTLALVYLASNARYGSALLRRRSQRVMTREERDVIHGVLARVPAAVATWSHGNASMDPFDVVEVRRPLRTLSSSGGGNWWAAPRDTRDDVRELAGGRTYDAIYVLWPSGGDVPH